MSAQRDKSTALLTVWICELTLHSETDARWNIKKQKHVRTTDKVNGQPCGSD